MKLTFAVKHLRAPCDSDPNGGTQVQVDVQPWQTRSTHIFRLIRSLLVLVARYAGLT